MNSLLTALLFARHLRNLSEDFSPLPIMAQKLGPREKSASCKRNSYFW